MSINLLGKRGNQLLPGKTIRKCEIKVFLALPPCTRPLQNRYVTNSNVWGKNCAWVTWEPQRGGGLGCSQHLTELSGNYSSLTNPSGNEENKLPVTKGMQTGGRNGSHQPCSSTPGAWTEVLQAFVQLTSLTHLQSPPWLRGLLPWRHWDRAGPPAVDSSSEGHNLPGNPVES